MARGKALFVFCVVRTVGYVVADARCTGQQTPPKCGQPTGGISRTVVFGGLSGAIWYRPPLTARLSSGAPVLERSVP